MGDVQEVYLKDGTRQPQAAVDAVMVALHIYVQSPEVADLLALWELAECAQDSAHVVFGTLGLQLKSWGLVEDLNGDGTARMHDVTRSVVRSALSLNHDDVTVVLSSPYAGED